MGRSAAVARKKEKIPAVRISPILVISGKLSIYCRIIDVLTVLIVTMEIKK